jgi:hypothetical protein
MPLFIYECQQCRFKLSHLVEQSFGPLYIYDCPCCKKNNKFNFLREANPLKDRLAELIIKNKRRRPGDKLYNTNDRQTKH